MNLIADLKSLEPRQRSAIWASYLGWTLDAFDYFLMVFMLSAIAREFGTDIKAVSQALFLTLAARPIGAFCFGRSAGNRSANARTWSPPKAWPTRM
jgi:MFS transporter, SHS family, lactate transporter